jgi:AcrR family transcriptional regulator
VSGPRSASAEFAAGEEPSDRKREILVACVRVLAERGFAKTRMSDIAAEVGVTAPLLLHYFGSKNELIIEALMAAEEPYLLKLREEFEAGDPPERLLVRYVEDSVSPPEGKAWWREASAVWINGWVTAMHDPAIARAREAEDRRWRELLTEIVEKGQAEGTFRAEVDASAFVWTLFALLEGFLVQLVLEDPQVSESFAHEQSLRFIADQLQFDSFEFSSSAKVGARGKV